MTGILRTGCNATLTTATVEPCPHSGCRGSTVVTDGVLCTDEFGDKWQHIIDLHTLTCDEAHHPDSIYHAGSPEVTKWVEWSDDTPGATPHVPPVEVSDAEVEAAARAWVWLGQPDDDPDEWETLWAKGELNLLRAALVAAKQVAQEVEA